jgi:hypothetical protein
MKKKTLWIAGAGALLAAVAGWLWVRSRQEKNTDIPPRNAPQLPIENPGDQSEFLTSPSESELG